MAEKNKPRDAMETAGTLQKPWKNKGLRLGHRVKWSGLLGATWEILRKMENLENHW
jgi:hypothetical protein